MTFSLWPCLIALAWPPVWGMLTLALFRYVCSGDALRRLIGRHWALAAVILLVLDSAVLDWAPVAFAAGNLLVGAWIWHRNRKNRKRAPRAYGAKSRALVAALVRRAREAAKPRPVLRPQPGGAQCA